MNYIFYYKNNTASDITIGTTVFGAGTMQIIPGSFYDNKADVGKLVYNLGTGDILGYNFDKTVLSAKDAIVSMYIIINSDYIIDDMIQPLMGKKLDTSAGKLDYDWQQKAIKVADSTSISNDTHKIHYSFQIPHKAVLDAFAHFHVHWIQSSSDVPNLWMRYRFWKNGGEAGSWTEQALDLQAKTYSSGTIINVAYNFDVIPFVNIGPSDFLDIEITRDINNDSGLFAGTDPVTGDVSIKGSDPHILINKHPGTNTEWGS